MHGFVPFLERRQRITVSVVGWVTTPNVLMDPTTCARPRGVGLRTLPIVPTAHTSQHESALVAAYHPISVYRSRLGEPTASRDHPHRAARVLGDELVDMAQQLGNVGTVSERDGQGGNR